MNHSTIHCLVSFAAAALVAIPASAERFERDYHETFDVRPGARLQLDHGDGDVTVTPWDKDVVEIDVRYRAESKGVGASRRSDFEVEFHQNGDTILVKGREPSFVGVGIFSFREHEYTYKVQAPPYVELSLAGEDGDATVRGWRASIEAESEDGDLRLSDVEAARFELELEDGDVEIDGLTGELWIETADGDAEVRDCSSPKARLETEDGDLLLERCDGSFDIRAADGDVELRQVRARRVAVETEDGDVVIGLLASPELDLTVVTEDGSVDVAVADLSAEIDVSTGDGRIRVDAPGADLKKSKRRVTGQVGGGGGRVRIETDDGDVTLRVQD